MALFGPAPGEAGAPAPTVAIPTFAPAVAAQPDPAGLPAFERRALLRDKRKRLVSELSRRDRRSHAEINGWLNRETGVSRVNDATLDQLERSCAVAAAGARAAAAVGPIRPCSATRSR